MQAMLVTTGMVGYGYDLIAIDGIANARKSSPFHPHWSLHTGRSLVVPAPCVGPIWRAGQKAGITPK